MERKQPPQLRSKHETDNSVHHVRYCALCGELAARCGCDVHPDFASTWRAKWESLLYTKGESKDASQIEDTKNVS